MFLSNERLVHKVLLYQRILNTLRIEHINSYYKDVSISEYNLKPAY